MLLEKLEDLRKFEISICKKIHERDKIANRGGNTTKISNEIKELREKINEILNENILEDIAFSNKEKYSKDKDVAIWYYYFKIIPEFDKKGHLLRYTWEDAYLSHYPAPFDDIDRDLTEAEEADCAKKLAQDVDACKRRIFDAIKRYEKTLKKF